MEGPYTITCVISLSFSHTHTHTLNLSHTHSISFFTSSLALTHTHTHTLHLFLYLLNFLCTKKQNFQKDKIIQPYAVLISNVNVSVDETKNEIFDKKRKCSISLLKNFMCINPLFYFLKKSANLQCV